MAEFDYKEYSKGKEVLVRAHGVEKTYQIGAELTHALRGINLEIYRGEYICVMGPSGSGKSTFFNMLGGLDSPTAGKVFMDEVDMAQLNAKELAFLRCRKIGYVFQSYNLNTVMTALENVTLPMIFSGMHQDDARQRGMKLLDKVGLGDRWNHRPKEMSGGQQQRVAIARSLANNPSLLLCDEPTANLDFVTGQEVHKILQDLNKEEGVTIICATHDHDMLAVSDRMIWISDGMIERVEETKNVKIEKASMGEAHE
ncbi:MAG: ABC transporter ATP-binding protein [Lentisphaeria bacterium]|nr:ABC transporter ATP-binding protein [Lentisphaeria bacterium]NQZ71031.1 ABC transporter ATP-binding protein [Lentisphaeria bacterium]